MANLGIWGGVAGAGGAYQDVKKQEAKTADASKAAKMDRQHDIFMEELRQKGTETHQGQKGGQALEQIAASGDESLEQIEAKGDEGIELQDTKAEDSKDLRTLDARFDSELSAQKHGETMTEQRAKANLDWKIKGKEKQYAAALDRFKPKILSVSEANEYGIAIEVDTPAIFDSGASKWYLQEGEDLRLAGEEGKKRRAPQVAITDLMKNPTPGQAEAFYGDYKYLPISYLRTLNKYALSVYEQAPAP